MSTAAAIVSFGLVVGSVSLAVTLAFAFLISSDFVYIFRFILLYSP